MKSESLMLAHKAEGLLLALEPGWWKRKVKGVGSGKKRSPVFWRPDF